jgi:hypothetical protein
MSECATIKHLKEIAAAKHGADVSLQAAASRALDIISDLDRPSTYPDYVDLLHHLVEGIYKEGKVQLFDHLVHGSPDCEICAAIKMRVEATGC